MLIRGDSFAVAATNLVGRDREMQDACHLLDRVAAGRGGVLVVEGEAGIGKTAVLAAVMAVALSRGMTVLHGAARELEQLVPFAAIGRCLPEERSAAGASSEPRHLPDENGGAPMNEAACRETAVVERAVALLHQLAGDGPVVACLDDAQWADKLSLSVLERIADSVGQPAVLLMLAARPSPNREELAGVLERLGSRGRRLYLGPLDDRAIAALAEDIGGLPAGLDITASLRWAGGNPRFASELVRGLGGRAGHQDGVVGGNGQVRPGNGVLESLRDAVSDCLQSISTADRRLLAMAAALGPDVDAGALAMVVGAPVVDVWNAVGRATKAGIMIQQADALVFRHELMREILAREVPAATRADLQRRAARLLMSMNASAERIAPRLLAFHGPLDRDSIDWVVATVEPMITRAPQLALDLLERALTIDELDEDIRGGLQLHRVRALFWTGRTVEAAAAARAALTAIESASSASADPAALRWMLALADFGLGRLSDVLGATENALAAPNLDYDDAVRFHGLRSMAHMLCGRFEEAQFASQEAMSVAENCIEPSAVEWALCASGSLDYSQDRLDEALTLGDRVLAIFESTVSARSSECNPHGLRSRCLIELDRLPEAETALEAAVRHCRQYQGIYLGMSLFHQAWWHFLTGRWDEALAEIDACRQAPDTLGFHQASNNLAALIGIHQGTAPGQASLRQTDQHLGDLLFPLLQSWAGALASEADNSSGDAATRLVAAIRLDMVGHTMPAMHSLYPDIVRLAVEIGDAQTAARVAHAADAAAEAQAIPSRRGAALYCRGLADSRPDLLEAAAELFRQSARSLHQGYAYEGLAVVLAGHGRQAEARRALADAIDCYSSLDAIWDIARAKAHVRAQGIRMGRGRSRRSAYRGWDALTPAEVRVATMVADGKSNADIAAQLFLSRRTVQTHVSNILKKLAVRSRVQIVIERSEQSRRMS